MCDLIAYLQATIFYVYNNIQRLKDDLYLSAIMYFFYKIYIEKKKRNMRLTGRRLGPLNEE